MSMAVRAPKEEPRPEGELTDLEIKIFLGPVNGAKQILREEMMEKGRRRGRGEERGGKEKDGEDEEAERSRGRGGKGGRQGGLGDPQLTQHFRPSISKSRWFSWSWRSVEGTFC